MPDDLPAIDPSLDAPLPQMDPNSALVPYRMSRTEPGGQPIVTTGYGPRARPPIQPPESFGGGVGMPSLDQIYNAAFSNLPVDQAIKAAEAATRFVGQRGYQRDLANGMSAAQAFAKWGPMLFHQATGIPEAINRSVPPPLSPYQQQLLAIRRQEMSAKSDAAKAKADAAKSKLHVLSSGEVLQETGDPNNPVKVVRERSGAGADKDIDYQIKAQNLMGLKPTELPTDPSYQSRTNLAAEIQKRHPLKTTTPNPAQTKSKEIIRLTKDGKKAVFDADTKKFIRYAE